MIGESVLSRIAYVNGRYTPQAQAAVGIEDRGFQFADGVYEVIEVQGGVLVDETLHLERLRRSLDELAIAAPLGAPALKLVIRETVRRNRIDDGMVYIQVTRGVARRDHVFPDPAVKPSVVVTARAIDAAALRDKAERGIKVITIPDIRWKRPDIKSISLLPNVLAKQEAKTRGAGEAWLVGPDGNITEGAASNAWIVGASGTVVTHPVDRSILKGVTRTTLLKLLDDLGLTFEERPFSPEEAYGAREAFITGATTLVMPVIAVDDRPVGQGAPGALTRELRRRFHDMAELSSSAAAQRGIVARTGREFRPLPPSRQTN
jgi:D-alanine transaminase